MSRCGAGFVEIGFDRKNPAAIAWAREHGAALVADVTDEARAAIRTAIARSLDEGIPPRVAARLIRDVVGLNERQVEAVMNYRADLAMAGDDAGAIARKAECYAGELRRQRALTIARTETMRASNEGQLQLWQQARSRGLLTGAARRRWIATDDEKTCPICGGLDGKEAALDANFSPRIKAPPAHPNCLLGHCFVSPGGRISAASKRWFDGDTLVVRTSRDRVLACTPNHPILTPRGWVPARGLYVGCDVVCDGRVDRATTRVDVNHQQVPPAIEDVADAILKSAAISTSTVETSAEDFHGDGSGSEIAVVGTYLKLSDGLDAAICEHRLQASLVAAVDSRRSLPRDGSSHELVGVGLSTSARGVRAGYLRRSLSAIHATPLQEFRLGSAPRFDGAFVEAPVDDLSTDAAIASDAIDGRAGEVARDDVVAVDWLSFHGFVYNLQTERGWYSAGGIITHNCRCTTALVRATEAA